jgi:hypothetical protein
MQLPVSIKLGLGSFWDAEEKGDIAFKTACGITGEQQINSII